MSRLSYHRKLSSTTTNSKESRRARRLTYQCSYSFWTIWCLILGMYWILLAACLWNGLLQGDARAYSGNLDNRFLLTAVQSFPVQPATSMPTPLDALSTLNETARPFGSEDQGSKGEGEESGSRSISRHLKWHNKFDLVHVVHTRFMQTQPNLTHLGQARLGLFRAITLPSMMHQSSLEFLWIIRTDPDLDQTLLHELRSQVKQAHNAVLIASNQNENYIRTNNITKQSVLEGSYDLAMSYHAAAQTRPVLETRLDADDALSAHFIESIQSRIAAQMRSPHFGRGGRQSPSWMVLCSLDSLEWQLFSPWNKQSHEGAIVPANKASCITPGLTYAFDVHAHTLDLPTHKHFKFTKLVPPCSGSRLNNNCLERIAFTPQTTIFRARTPTSAGMDSVFASWSNPLDGSERNNQFAKFHHHAWKDLPIRFGIHVHELVQLRSELLENITLIAEDALQGQCTKFHSCKESARQQLEQFRTMSRNDKVL
ncbi:hypothetical protein ACA910_000880 [Epithemia clementina (nom. ined.)]